MQIKFDSCQLANKLSNVARFISKKPIIPVLKYACLEVNHGTMDLNIYATDLNCGIKETCSLTNWADLGTEKQTRLLVDVHKIIPFLKGIEGQIVNIQKDKNGVRFGFVNELNIAIELVFEALDAAEYPIDVFFLNEYQRIFEIKDRINSESYTQMLRQILPHCSTDELKMAMCGVLHEFLDTDIPGALRKENESSELIPRFLKLRIVATDAHTICIKEIDRLEASDLGVEDLKANFIISKEQGNHLTSLLDVKYGLSLWKSNSSDRVFYEADVSMIGRKICAVFPEYRNVFPKSFVSEIAIDRAIAIKIIARMMLFVTEESKYLIFSFDPKKEISISLAHQPAGQNVEKMFFRGDIPEKIEIGFNPALFLRVLNSFDTDHVQMGLNGPAVGVLFTAGPGEFDSFRTQVMLMPVMIGGY